MVPMSLGLLLALTACGREEAPPALPPAPISIQAPVVPVVMATVPVRVEVTGVVTAASQATLSSKIQGTVQEVRVREGSTVAKGQTLVLLDNRDLQAALAGAEADLENARAHLARMQRLYTQESVAKQELDNASRAFKVAEARREAALAQLSYTVIKAPFEGVISEKLVEAGELASPGQPLLKLEDHRHLRLEVTVAEGDLKAVAVGDQLPVIIDALGSAPLQARVSKILPAGDPRTHTFLVKIDLPPTTGLKSGMFGRLQLEKGSSQTLVIPRSALIERGKLTGVFVVGEDGVVRLRWIKAGRRIPARVAAVSGAPDAPLIDEQAEVLSGLNDGERILADATKGVDGARVQPVSAVADSQQP